MTRLRRAGSKWRLLVHEYAGGGYYGQAHDIRSTPYRGEQPSEWETRHLIEDTEFDELVVGRWIHIEQMDTSAYWMNVAGVVIDVRVDRDGNPKSVLIQHEPVPGVIYDWADEPPSHSAVAEGKPE